MKDRLTKTAYLNYLKCPQEFWLDYHHAPVEPEPITLEHEHLRQQGYLVQQLVKKRAEFQDSDSRLVEFERAFQTTDLYARSDIIVTDKSTGTLDIYEIKAAAKVKEEHYEDVAFQKVVIERNGFNVGRCFVITMNGEYVRQGEVDVEQLFVITDVTDDVEQRLEIWFRVIERLVGSERVAAMREDLKFLAESVDATGAQIKFAVLGAIFIAKRASQPLSIRHVLRGLERELAKEGRALGSRDRKRMLEAAG